MSGIDMATTDDLSGAKAHANRKFREANAYTDEKVAELEKKLSKLEAENVKLWATISELKEALQAADIPVGTKKE